MKTRLVEEFVYPGWASWLRENRMDRFDSWWSLSLSSVEVGNYNKGGGWSEVCFFEKHGRSFYIKRQRDHLCRNYASPFRRVPTAKAEQIKIGWYKKAAIPGPDPVFFGWRKSTRGQEAILVTEALTGYKNLSDIFLSLKARQKQALEKSIGQTIKKLHEAGIQHHNLYPKHILAKAHNQGWLINFIDLETSRPHFGNPRSKARDIETLFRRMDSWTASERLRILLAYEGKKRPDAKTRCLWRFVERRRAQKRR